MMAEIQEKLKYLSITLFMFEELNNTEEGENSLREEGGF